MQDFLTLTIFTTLGQAAAGMAMLKAICPRGVEQRRFSPWVIMAIILLGVGTLASIFHLNSPIKGYLAFSNPFESWLSLEIYSVILFGLSLLGCLYVNIYPLRLASGILGAFMVVAMAKVYMNANVPDWQSVNTMINFFASAFLLGAVSLYSSSSYCKEDKLAVTLGPLPKVIMIFLIVRIVAQALLVARSESSIDIQLMDSHITLVLVGAGLVLLMLMQCTAKYLHDPVTKKQPCYKCATALIFILVLAGELCGRAMFYNLFTPSGLG